MVFALTSGRSGTLFLYALLRHNLPDAVVMHEPTLRRGNPSMFGQPIHDHAVGNLDAVRRLLLTKRDTIARYKAAWYIETSHAFLKSYWDLAPAIFPPFKVFHLIRHPLEVARSEANRENFIRRWHLPFREYRADGQRHFRWALTGREPIFHEVAALSLTQFQRYLVQWIEIENRAMDFLTRFDMASRCLTLHTPLDLNDPQLLARVFSFLDLVPSATRVSSPLVQNRTPGNPTAIGADELQQCREVVAALPPRYLEIFRHAPYADQPWSSLLRQ